MQTDIVLMCLVFSVTPALFVVVGMTLKDIYKKFSDSRTQEEKELAAKFVESVLAGECRQIGYPLRIVRNVSLGTLLDGQLPLVI